MILTVTPSPAVDLTLELGQLELGAVNRSDHSEQEASGKGVNVSWALHRAGIETLALFPAGGTGKSFMTRALNDAQLPHRVVPIAAELRANVTLRPHLGLETKINSPGSPLSGEETSAFFLAIDQELSQASDVCICGSVPQGAPDDLIADIVRNAKRRGVRTLVDTSGTALDRAIDACPDIVTPNVHELFEITHTPLTTLGEVITASELIRSRGVETVVVTLGAAGALLLDSDGALWARATGVKPINSVGAGDALLAGLVSQKESPAEVLRTAVWWASSAVESMTTLFRLNPALLEGVKVTRDFSLSTTVN